MNNNINNNYYPINKDNDTISTNSVILPSNNTNTNNLMNNENLNLSNNSLSSSSTNLPLPSNLPSNITPEELQATLEWIDQIATFYDTRWRLGPVSFGIDSIVGLIPGISFTNTILSSFLALKASQIPSTIRHRLWIRVIIDFFINLIPGIGPILNIWYKANRRNANDILQYYGYNPTRLTTQQRNVSVVNLVRKNLHNRNNHDNNSSSNIIDSESNINPPLV